MEIPLTVTFYPQTFQLSESELTSLDNLKLWFETSTNSALKAVVQPDLSTEELIKVTQDVIDTLERNGWIQGQYQSETNGYCMMGAVRQVTNRSNAIAQWAVEIATHFEWSCVEFWNDEKGRTFEQVLTHLRDFLYELKGR